MRIRSTIYHMAYELPSHINMQKSPIYPQKSPIYPQKSPIYPQKSPIYPQKSPIYPQIRASDTISNRPLPPYPSFTCVTWLIHIYIYIYYRPCGSCRCTLLIHMCDMTLSRMSISNRPLPPHPSFTCAKHHITESCHIIHTCAQTHVYVECRKRALHGVPQKEPYMPKWLTPHTNGTPIWHVYVECHVYPHTRTWSAMCMWSAICLWSESFRTCEWGIYPQKSPIYPQIRASDTISNRPLPPHSSFTCAKWLIHIYIYICIYIYVTDLVVLAVPLF